MDAKKDDGKVSAANIVDTLINLAAMKRQQDRQMKQVNKSSFTVILILFKSFETQLQKYLQAQKVKSIDYYGLLRNEQVDEIELEPIEDTGDNQDY